MNRHLRRWHRLLGLSLGGMVALWCLSGGLLLCRPFLDPETGERIGDAPFPLTPVLAAAQRFYPKDSGSWRIDLPRRAGQPVRIRYIADDPFLGPEAPVALWVAPLSAKVLAVVEGRTPFLAACYRLHTTLLLPGRRPLVLVLPATVLGGLLLTGLLSGRRVTAPSWHHRIARLALPGLTLSLVTGLGLIAPQSWWPASEPTVPAPLPAPDGDEPISVDEAVATARQAVSPRAGLRRVQLSGEPDEPWTVFFHVPGTLDVEPAWTRVYVDPRHDRVTAVREGRGRMRQWLYLIHTGAVLEPFCRALLLLGATGPLLLAVTGLTRWYRRHRRYGLPAPQNSA